jgi:hypothetical protein
MRCQWCQQLYRGPNLKYAELAKQVIGLPVAAHLGLSPAVICRSNRKIESTDLNKTKAGKKQKAFLLHFCSFKGMKEQTVENRVISIAFYSHHRR